MFAFENPATLNRKLNSLDGVGREMVESREFGQNL
jgi:hypothetical protein